MTQERLSDLELLSIERERLFVRIRIRIFVYLMT